MIVDIIESAKLAKSNVYYVQFLTNKEKNDMLKIIADAIVANKDSIIAANKIDIDNCKNKPKHFIDRLMLNNERIQSIAEGVLQLANLQDPIGEVVDTFQTAKNLQISKVRVPLGVICIIYEARPNVTVDAIALCLKSGNASLLRGSGDTINSNKKIVEIIKTALSKSGYNPDFISLIEDTSRESVSKLFKLNSCIDVIIPRGGAGLIKNVVENSSVPVIETGTGKCHIYVEKHADFDMAKNILYNSKTNRPSACNAAESLLVDEDIAEKFLPIAYQELQKSNVEFFGCEKTLKILPQAKAACDEDFYTEYLDYKISCKIVKNTDEAISHINKYGTKHSDCIVTSDENATDKFLQYVDSSSVYHNASTRFTDGFEFGLGAEMGISTQKLHARGPMGLTELTSYKYIIKGNGQIRK